MAVFLLAVYGHFVWGQTQTELRRSQEYSLARLQNRINADLLQNERALRYVATLLEKQTHPFSAASWELALQALQSLEPGMSGTALYLANGERIQGSGGDEKGLFSAFSGAPASGRLQLSRLYEVERDKSWAFGLRYPLMSRSGSLDGFLVVTLPVNEMGGKWSDFAPSGVGRLGLLRDDGYLQGLWPLPGGADLQKLFGSSRTGAFRQTLLDQHFPESGHVRGLNTVEGEEVDHVFQRLKDFPLTLALTTPVKAMVRMWWDRMFPVVVFAGLFIAVIGLTWWRMARSAGPQNPPRQPRESGATAMERDRDYLLDHLTIGVALHAANGTLIYCNKDAQRLIGLTRDQVFGKASLNPDWRLLDEDGAPLHSSRYPVARVIHSRRKVVAQLVGVKTADNAKVQWLLGDATPIFSENGELQQILVTFMDVTQRQESEAKHRETELVYRSLVNNSLNIVLQFSQTGIVRFANPAACKVFGLTSEELLHRHISQLVDVHETRYAELIRQRDAAGQAKGELALLLRGGTRIDAEVSMNAHQGADGQMVTSIVANDITERQKVWHALQSSEMRMKGIVDSAMDAIICINVRQEILVFNPSAQRMFGYSAEEMMGQSIERLMPEGVRALHREHVARFAETGHSNRLMGPLTQLSALRRDGTLFPIEASISQVITTEQRLLTVILRDVTSRVEAQLALEASARDIARANAQLEHIAHFDVLTGLPNRSLLADRLRQGLLHCERSGRFMAVAFLDLDGFKEVNDNFGHQVGDKLLMVLSHRMKIALREEDTLARVGGDEFVAVLANLDSTSDCEPILDRLLFAASEPLIIDDFPVRVSCSIGVTIYPKDGVEAEMLLRHADQAMYLAKQAGKGRYEFFDVDQDARIHSRTVEIEAVRHGLERQEFRLFYQPKVNLISGKVVGCEALIRWQHPERGLLPPGLFLPQIEDDVISITLGEWVIENALKQMSQWLQEGLSLPVSVNIGAQQLQADGFVEYVAACIRRYPEVSPQSLELEVLETSALEDISKVSRVMLELRKMGIRFALDDFGTGYSSLTYLKLLPAELLKVDQSFVRDMLVDSDDRAIVRAVVSLAKAFAREVIAEGVETAAHGKHLIDMGCHLAQGYGIARPMPPGDLPGWINHWGSDPAKFFSSDANDFVV